jgi:hypothetical protein
MSSGDPTTNTSWLEELVGQRGVSPPTRLADYAADIWESEAERDDFVAAVYASRARDRSVTSPRPATG